MKNERKKLSLRSEINQIKVKDKKIGNAQKSHLEAGELFFFIEEGGKRRKRRKKRKEREKRKKRVRERKEKEKILKR